MLDADEHGFLVGRDKYAGDLALFGPDQKSPRLSGCGIGAEHLVVAEAVIGACIDGAGRYVGLNPESTARRHIDPVRRAILVADDRRPVSRICWVAAEGEDVPTERRFRKVVAVEPADDVAVDIVHAWIGGIHRRPGRAGGGGAIGVVDRHRCRAAPVVVGKRRDRGERLGKGVDPLRPVHHGGTDCISRAASVDEDIVQRPAAGRQGRIAGRQRQPLARAVGVEFCDIENPVVERVDPQETSLAPGLVRDVAVDVFVPFVVPHVDDHFAILGLLDPRALVLQTAERGALHRSRVRPERIDFHHPTEAVRFIDLDVGVEPHVSGIQPRTRPEGSDPISILHRGLRKGLLKESIEILFACEIRPPRREAHGAIVQRPEHPCACRIRGGREPGIARSRTADVDRSHAGDASGKRRRADDIPLAAPSPPVPWKSASLGDLDDRDTMGIETLVGFLLVPIGDTVTKQQAIIGVLVVLDEQPTLGAQDREIHHAVVVHTPLSGLVSGTVAGVLFEGRPV